MPTTEATPPALLRPLAEYRTPRVGRRVTSATRDRAMRSHPIGAGVGRTGTNSLKLAINRLGLGPCHHMLEVRENMTVHMPLWQAAADGRPD